MNIIIKGNDDPITDKILFGNESVIYSSEKKIEGLLTELGIYKSKSQARQAGRSGIIPYGYTEYKANKHTFLYIWNPEHPVEYYKERG